MMQKKKTEIHRLKFVLFQLCQRLPDYGAHLHRVFTSKPSVNLGNTPFGDPETGVAQWIGILARGIVQYEEQRSVLCQCGSKCRRETFIARRRRVRQRKTINNCFNVS